MKTIQEIKAYMKQNNITYQELSDRSGIPLNTLKNIFCGKTKHPRIDTMQAIERALGIEEEKTPPDDDLSEGEMLLLDLFRNASEEQQQMVLQLLRLALSQK